MDVETLYQRRFELLESYRRAVWARLIDGFFQQFVRPADVVVDLGAGYCEFINQVRAGTRIAIDMNPATRKHATAGVQVLDFDVTDTWKLQPEAADVVFTSNFFEHLESKSALTKCVSEIYRVLRPGGILLALGPNIRFCSREYWDFYDHFIPLSDRSLCELLQSQGFTLERVEDRFLPYSMSQGTRAPLIAVSIFLKVPALWKIFGKQFLVVAVKPQ